MKERLTGALIFVAAVVVIVPEMFSGPQPKPAAIAPAQADEAGLPLRTFSMALDDSGEARAIAPTTPAAAVPEPEPEPPAAQQPPDVRQPTAEPLPASASVAAVAMNPPAPDVVTSISGASWWLQVGIFSVRDNAERFVQKLRAGGFAVEMDKQAIGGKDMYRVRAGPVRDRTEAVALQARLKAAGNDSRLLPP